MAGVAGPMLRESRSTGMRFLTGLVVGSLVTALVLALALVVTGDALTSALPFGVRASVAAAVLISLAVLDIVNRTPHVWRQVPQRLVRELPAGQLGLVWGADLGTLVSTQKTTSLIWGSLAACVLLDPGTAAVLAVAVSLIATLVIGASSHLPTAGFQHARPIRTLVPLVRKFSGALLALTGVFVVLELF
ncbi:MAG: hypothetical protein M3Y42_04070 [Actinomycetota bacterium]|nr:hypothetical protein [Actinomycetota bacterium]